MGIMLHTGSRVIKNQAKQNVINFDLLYDLIIIQNTRIKILTENSTLGSNNDFFIETV